MAGPQAAEEPTPEQMVREMQAAQFHPGGEAPQPAELEPDQMIAEMQSAGYHPQAAPEDNRSWLTKFGDRLAAPANENQPSDADTFASAAKGMTAAATTPEVAGTAGGMLGALLPVPGGAEAGAGAAAAASSGARDMIDRYADGAQKSNEDIAKNAGIEGAKAAAAQLTGGLLVKAGTKLAKAAATKFIPEAVLTKFSEAAEAVEKLWANSGKDVGEAADTVRRGIGESLDAKRKELGGQISEFLQGSKERVNMTPVLAKLEAARDAINPKLNPEKVAPFNDLIKRIKSASGMLDEPTTSGLVDSYGKPISRAATGDGSQVPVSLANDIKKTLQDEATGAYRNLGEFGKGSEFANAAKNAAAVARKTVNKVAPEVAGANEELAQMHWIEDRMNKSLIRAGKSPSALIAAGEAGKEGSMNVTMLKRLGEITGKDFLGQAQTLAAAKTFGNATLGNALQAPVKSGVPYAIKQGITLGKALPPPAIALGAQAAGRVTDQVGLSLGQMYGMGAANSLQDMSKQNGIGQ